MSSREVRLLVGLLVGLSIGLAPSRELQFTGLYEGRPADAAYLECAGFADSVLLPEQNQSGGVVAVTRSIAQAMTLQPYTRGPVGVPIEIPPELKKPGRWHVLAVSNGWLLGWDHGEYGGGLWYLARNDGRATIVEARRVTALFRTMAGNILALVGPASASVGVVASVEHTARGWHVTKLGAGPGGVGLISTPSPDGQYVWSDGLSRIKANGEVEPWSDYSSGALQGFALALDDEYVYVGLRLALLRVRLTDHAETWFYACDPSKMRKVAVPARLVFNGKTTTFMRTVCRCQ